MADIVFVLLALGFFAVCVLYVRGIERMIPATEELPESTGEAGR